MIFGAALNRIMDIGFKPTWTRPELVSTLNLLSSSGQKVGIENSNNVSTAYRCMNIISDDIAKMPLQTFVSRRPGEIERLRPSAAQRNIPWRIERKPNRWQTPFMFKKRAVLWLLAYGNAYIWRPTGANNELFELGSDVTTPWLDASGDLWYKTRFPKAANDEFLPAAEVLHLLINPDKTGLHGRGVIQFAKDTIGRQMAAHASQDGMYKRGLSAGGILWLDGESSRDIRDKVRDTYEERMSGPDNTSRIAVLDKRVAKFEPITMRATDMQFLQSIQQNDAEIANYFGLPLHKLNMGKQSYESNTQQQLDYLSTTIDPYLVQWEEASHLKWLNEYEQDFTYFRFERSVLLRTDPKSRGEYLNGAINNGRLSPNEARQIEDRPAAPDEAANWLYMPVNVQPMKMHQGESSNA